MLRQIEGSRAVAETVARCRPEVICAYPISPQTHIVEALSELVKSGLARANTSMSSRSSPRYQWRSAPPRLQTVRRVSTFEEVVGGLDEETALFEARRCMSGGNCFECDNCYGMCPDNAIIKARAGTTLPHRSGRMTTDMRRPECGTLPGPSSLTWGHFASDSSRAASPSLAAGSGLAEAIMPANVRRPSIAARRFGYIVAAAVTVAIFNVINVWPGWRECRSSPTTPARCCGWSTSRCSPGSP
jgi:hypothetical protein